jgi:hypothetical protein
VGAVAAFARPVDAGWGVVPCPPNIMTVFSLLAERATPFGSPTETFSDPCPVPSAGAYLGGGGGSSALVSSVVPS